MFILLGVQLKLFVNTFFLIPCVTMMLRQFKNVNKMLTKINKNLENIGDTWVVAANTLFNL